MHLTSKEYLTVSQLNRRIRLWLEDDVGEVHVSGEVSNCARPSSGHIYFTLKDNSAQIKSVFFKNRHDAFVRNLQDGLQVEVRGRLSLYEPRGDYQLIVEHLAPAGVGDLYREFEQLKLKLKMQGLFEEKNKKLIPKFPETIGIITSKTGAAIRDILTTLSRRYPVAKILIYATEVQGKQAAPKLIQAVEKANIENQADVLILARGGGSIEDLWAFNDEQLARAIAKSTIPIISGVGHETDFTIADFVADLRAATPTAAAVAATPDILELYQGIQRQILRLEQACERYFQKLIYRLKHCVGRLSSPEALMIKYSQSVDYLEKRLHQALLNHYQTKSHQLDLLCEKLQTSHPAHRLRYVHLQVDGLLKTLFQMMRQYHQVQSQRLGRLSRALHLMSPLATLERGYAIASAKEHILLSVKQVACNEHIEVRLRDGRLFCEVLECLELERDNP